MKYTKEDNLYVNYCGIDLQVVEVVYLGRKGKDAPVTEFITLLDGTKIVPAHFKYNLAKHIGGVYQWLLKVHLPLSIMKMEIHAAEFFKLTIPKEEDKFGGKYIPIPFTYGEK